MRARGAGGLRGQHAVDQLLHFDHVALIAAAAVVAPVVGALAALDHHGDHRRDLVRGDQAVEFALQPELQEGGGALFVAVQQVEHGVARAALGEAGRQVDVEGAFAAERGRGVAGGVDRAAGGVVAAGEQRRQRRRRRRTAGAAARPAAGAAAAR